jgi:hypothetical protein
MQTFVQTLRDHLRDAGAPHDDERFGRRWRVFNFLFDFTANGSATDELVRERAAHALAPVDRAKAASLRLVRQARSGSAHIPELR